LTVSIEEVSRRFRRDARITILTGAGVSAASGVPTFRGTAGLWKSFRPESLATPEAFRRDPKLVWEWYDWRRQLISTKQPNRAHDVIANWSRRYPDFTLITQNVDGLHEKAGTRNVTRFHGSIWELSCWERCRSSPERWWDETSPLPEIPPRCPHCNGLVRPGVVWFGEAIDPVILERSRQSTNCDLFLTIGTSAVVHPAASLVFEAKQQGAYTVEINVESTPASNVIDATLQGPAETVLPDLEFLIGT
jgi:NAD-dependent deacetylase